MREGTHSKIEHEINQIDELLTSYSPLLKLAQLRTPDLTEKSALATVLHSFYGGIENLFGIIAKEIDHEIPSGGNWHRSLLNLMSQNNEHRDKVLAKNEREMLLEYLSFRHFFRHAYSFSLDWDQMRSLVIDIEKNWGIIKKKIINIRLLHE